LRINQLQRNIPRVLHRLDNSRLGNLVKDDPFYRDSFLFTIKAERRQEMPGDSLPFAVGVGSKEKSISSFQLFLDRIEMLLALRQHSVFRLKAIGDINRTLLARQRPYMSERGEHPITGSEKFFNGFRLGRRLDDDKFVWHNYL